MERDEARNLLARIGYELGHDEPGAWGWLAYTACAAFQHSRGLPVTGRVDPMTAAALRSGKRTPFGTARRRRRAVRAR